MEDFIIYECSKCQIRKHIFINEKFDFKCKCCGNKMKYVTTVRKNKADYGSNNYSKMQAVTLSTQQNIPKCPTCGSTNLSKISNVGKAAKIGLFGIFGAGDLGKTWKCNNCGNKL